MERNALGSRNSTQEPSLSEKSSSGSDDTATMSTG